MARSGTQVFATCLLALTLFAALCHSCQNKDLQGLEKENTLRIALISLSTGAVAKPYVARSAVNKAMYCTRNDYSFRMFHHLDESRPPAWSKILALKALVKSCKYDWVFWMDTDCIITNFQTRIQSFIPNDETVDFVVSKDCNELNTGVFLMRSSVSALRLLEEIYNGPHVDESVLGHFWWEQQSFALMYKNPDSLLKNRTLVVPQKTFNSYPPGLGCFDSEGYGWSGADFAIHFPGHSDEAREAAIEEYLQKVIH